MPAATAAIAAARQPVDIEPLRRLFIDGGAVARADELGLLAPGRDLHRIVRVAGEPCLDGAKTFRRQLAIDIGVELVFAHNLVSINHRSLSSSFHAAQRRALAVKKGLYLRTRARQPRHHRADRHALDLGDLAIGEALEHDEQQRRALILGKLVERPSNVAAAGIRSAGHGVVVVDLRQHRPPRQAAQPVAVEVGQDGVKPCPRISAVKQML